MGEVVVDLGVLGAEGVEFVVVLVDVVKGDATDGDLEKVVDLVVGEGVFEEVGVGLEAGADLGEDGLGGLDALDALVDALFDEEGLEGLAEDELLDLTEADLELAAEDVLEELGVAGEDLGDGHLAGAVLGEDDDAAGDAALAVGEGVERLTHLVGIGARVEGELDLDGLGGEVVDVLDGEALGLDGLLDGLGEAVGGDAVRDGGDEELVLLAFAFLDAGADLDGAAAIVVVRGVHLAAGDEVRHQDGAGMALENLNLGLKELDEVVREDGGGEADCDAVDAEHEAEGNLGGEEDGSVILGEKSCSRASLVRRHSM